MKYNKIVVALVLFLVLFFCRNVRVYAEFGITKQKEIATEFFKLKDDEAFLDDSDKSMQQITQINGFVTEEYPEEKKTELINRLNIVKIITKPQKALMIDCFDVNNDGLIVMSSGDSIKKIIQVYKDDGEFQYGFELESEGSIGVEWIENDYIAIYYVRSSLAVIINPEGEIINILKIRDDSVENSIRMHEVSSAIKKTVGEKTYVPRNDAGFLNIFLSSFGELVVINEQGQEHSIYDVNSFQVARVIGMFVAIILTVVIVVIVITKEFIKLNKK